MMLEAYFSLSRICYQFPFAPDPRRHFFKGTRGVPSSRCGVAYSYAARCPGMHEAGGTCR